MPDRPGGIPVPTGLGWRSLLAAAPALALMALALRYYGDFVSDDAFISFRYAEHLATGRGLEWNPGYRVEGYSNFLWVLLLAAGRMLGMAVPEAARLLSTVAALGTVALVVLVIGWGRRRTDPLLLALAPLPVALSFPFQYWCSMRLETALFALLLLLAPALFLREEAAGPGARRWPSALAYLALALTRPEGLVYAVIPVGHLLTRVATGEDVRALARQRMAWLGIIVAGVALLFLFRWSYFGELLPNTFHAKVEGGGGSAWGWSYLTRFCAERPYYLVLFLAPLLLGGTRNPAGPVLLGTALLSALVAVAVGGDWMQEFRLLVPITPLLAATLGITLQRINAHHSGPRGAAERVTVITGAALLVAGVQLNMGTPRHELADAMAGKRRDLLINLEGEMTRAGSEAGRWLRANARPGDLVAVNHAGAVPFYSGLPTLDMVGLNDRHIARLAGDMHGKYDPEYVLSRRPRFVVLNTRVQPSGGHYTAGYWAGEDALFTHPEFQRRYEPVAPYWTWRHRSIRLRNHPIQNTAYIMIFKRKEESSPSGLQQAAPRGKATDKDDVSSLRDEPR